jgi:hypothetical protein
MTESTFIIFFTLLFGVLPCAVAGYFISFKQQRGLISGWDDAKYKDPQKAAKIIGNSLLLLSVIILIFSFLLGFELLPKHIINYSIIVVIIPIGSLIYAHKKYGVN